MFFRGAFRAAYRVALSETVPGCEEREGTRQIRSLEVVHACAEDVVAPPSMRRFGQIGRAVSSFCRRSVGRCGEREQFGRRQGASVTTSWRRLRERHDDLERRPPGPYVCGRDVLSQTGIGG